MFNINMFPVILRKFFGLKFAGVTKERWMDGWFIDPERNSR